LDSSPRSDVTPPPAEAQEAGVPPAAAAAPAVRPEPGARDLDAGALAFNPVGPLEQNTSRDDLIDAVGELLPGKNPGHRQGALIIAAIGNLSLINEAFGFNVGDEVITIVGKRLRSCLRERDCFARFGSNKFGILLADCEPDKLEFVAKRMIAAVRQSLIETSAGAVSMTLRMGAVLLPRQATTVQDAFSNALDALDSAREKRGDCYRLFDSSGGRISRRTRNILIVDEVIRALNERRMMLALQPIVRSGGRQPGFYECLLRMQKTDGTFVTAGEFVPIAEKLGLAKLIDHRVAELAVGLLKSAPNLKLAINVSGETANDKEWLSLLLALTQGDRSINERLMVEITETAAISDIQESACFVRALKKVGCLVAIDDFGAGYSSFRNLKFLDVDMVKIDGEFVRNVARSKDDLFLVKTLISLARNFSMRTVAEWVGDEETAVLMERAGIDFLQGFHFGKPKLVGVGAQTAPQQPATQQRAGEPAPSEPLRQPPPLQPSKPDSAAAG